MSQIQVVYLDDEIHQHIAFESLVPEEWEVFCFDNPVEAMETVSNLKPALVVSDQRMPQMQGFKFLEMVKSISPESVRVITTGYNDENSIVESIRSAQIFDYIIKPWDTDKLLASLERAISFHQSEHERINLTTELKSRNQELVTTCEKLTQSLESREKIEKELECWIPPIVSYATKENLNFPLNKDLALMAIDIVDSGSLHNLNIGAHTARQKILLEFSMLVVKHGGYVETFQGDAAYANFGLMETGVDPCDAAFAVANEFRAALVGIQNSFDTTIECGVGLHFGKGVKAMIHEYSVTTSQGIVIQKRFSTESSGIDLVHRMEKLTHKLPGSNIVMTKDFCDTIKSKLPSQALVDIGSHLFKGQDSAYDLVLIPSNKASSDDIAVVQALPEVDKKAA